MKKVLFALTVISAIMINYSCMTSEKRINKFKRLHCKDFTTTIVKDSLIKIPIYYTDSAYMSLFLACDSNGQIYQIEKETLQGKISTLESRLTDNKVYITSKVKVTDTVVKIVTNTIEKTGANIYSEKPLKTWQKVCIWGFFIFCGVSILYIVWRLFKMKIKIDVTGI